MRTLGQTQLPAQLSRMAGEWQHCRLPPKYKTLRIGRHLALGGKMLTVCVLSKAVALGVFLKVGHLLAHRSATRTKEPKSFVRDERRIR